MSTIYLLKFQYSKYDEPTTIGVFTSVELLNEAIRIHQDNDIAQCGTALGDYYHQVMQLDLLPEVEIPLHATYEEPVEPEPEHNPGYWYNDEDGNSSHTYDYEESIGE